MDRNKMRRQAQVLRNKKRVRVTRKINAQVKGGVIKIDAPLPRKKTITTPKPISTISQINKKQLEQRKEVSAQAAKRKMLSKYRTRKRNCGSCNRKIGNK